MDGQVISQPGGDSADNSGAGPSQSSDRSLPTFQPTQDEITVVQHWLQRVERAEKAPKRKAWCEDLPNLRGYLEGTKHDDKTGKRLVRTNMIYATIAAMMPELYARNPEIAVTPTDSVPQAEMGKIKRFCKTAERGLRKFLVEEGKLKKRAKANIRATCATSYGVLKVIYQKEYRGDPVIVRRIEDAQDQLARIEQLAGEARKETDPTKLAKIKDDLSTNLKALHSQNEVRMFKGFAIDRMKSEDFIVLDESIAEFDEYEDADALGHLIWMRVSDAKVLFNMNPHGATKYGSPRPEKDSATKVDDTPAEEQFICVVEIWDKKNGVVRTTAKGMNRWLREPYAPPHTPQRWYPFYALGFNLVEGQWRPLSDVELLQGLQDEYNTTRTNYADVREKAVPVTFFRKAGNLTAEDVKNIVNRGNKDMIGIEGNPTIPINQDVLRLEGPTIDPQAYDVTMIRNDMDLVVGRSDASRANLIKPKTATEAEIMNEAMQSRVGERRDTHEDLLSEMGEAALEIMLRDVTKVEMQQIAGPDCEWPETPETVEEIFRMVTVRVRAGSSGKPNQQKEREQWTQLQPVINETMKQVAELRAAGDFEGAEAVLELLRETLRRFEERLDLDAIIPPTKKDENGVPIAHQQAAMQLVQTQEELQLCKEELAKCQQELEKAKAGEAVKLTQAQNQRDLDEAKAKDDAAFQRWKAILDGAVKIQQTEIQAAATANAENEQQQKEAMQAAASEDRLAQIVQELTATMDKLGSAIGRLPQQGAGE